MPVTELQLICEIGNVIASSTDFHESLRRVAELIAHHLGVEVCNIIIYHESTDELVLEGTCGFEQEVVHHIRMSPHEGIIGHCFRSQELINVAQKQEHPDFKPFDSGIAPQYSALLGVPLIAGGHAIGVLSMERREAEEFPASTVALTQAIASPLSVFVRNVHLTEKISTRRVETPRTSSENVVLKGTPITDGVVRGRAYFLIGGEILEETRMEYAEDVDAEKELLEAALQVAREDTLELQREAAEVLAEADAAIFYAHLLLLDDATLIERLNQNLDKGFTLRSSLKAAYSEFEKELSSLENELVRERLADLKDVILRMYQAADEVEGKSQRPFSAREMSESPVPIVIAYELLPSQLIRLPLADLAGIVCEQGGTTSHVAILAKTLQIPMLVGVSHVTGVVKQNDDLILDCMSGSCCVRPTKDVLQKFHPSLEEKSEEVESPSCTLAMTTDGASVRLGGNISLINELPLLNRYGAAGVGLYRTEFMFMIRNSYPSEEEQYSLFRKVVEGGQGSSVTIRLLDVGGDKPLPYVNFGREENPALGWRGLRFLLSNRNFLDVHLRAILRTTVHGRVNILVPMVADLEELLEVKHALKRAENHLKSADVEFATDYRLGVMLEVPSAYESLDHMLPHIDFVSIGSNDLVQYLFAVDRGNTRMTRWFRQFHPVVLRMIKAVCDKVKALDGKGVSLCGEMAGIPLGVPFLIGAGIDYLSMNPWRIPKVRDAIAKVSKKECEALAKEAISCKLDSEVVDLMHRFGTAHDIPGSLEESAEPAFEIDTV